MIRLVHKSLILAFITVAATAMASRLPDEGSSAGEPDGNASRRGICSDAFGIRSINYAGPIKDYSGPATRHDQTIKERLATGRGLIQGDSPDMLFPRLFPLVETVYPYEDFRLRWRSLRNRGYEVGVLGVDDLRRQPQDGRADMYSVDPEREKIYLNPYQIDFEPSLVFMHAVIRAEMYHLIMDDLDSRALQSLSRHTPALTYLYLDRHFGFFQEFDDEDSDEENDERITLAYREMQAMLIGIIAAELAVWEAYKVWRVDWLAPQIKNATDERRIYSGAQIDAQVVRSLVQQTGMARYHAERFLLAVRRSGILIEKGFGRLCYHPVTPSEMQQP